MSKVIVARLDRDRTVEVQVRLHPGYRTLRLSVQPGGKVRLSAPKRTRRGLLVDFVRKHEDWLREHLPGTVAVPVPEYIALLALGENWQLEFDAHVSHLSISSHLVRVPQPAGPEAFGTLRRWLTNRARTELGNMLEEISTQTGLGYKRLSIRGQRSRWGSYSSHGNVSLNFKLLFLPEELVRYVLLHELCHGVHMNHSAAYWAEVAKHEPNLAELRSRMRGASSYLPGWLEQA